MKIDEEYQILRHILDSVVTDSKCQYNPIYLCGPHDRTSLIVAEFRNNFIKAHPNLSVFHSGAEDLSDGILEMTRFGIAVDPFKLFRETDLLIIERMELTGGRQLLMQYLFSAFDTVYENNKQILLTSEKLPNEIIGLEERNRAQYEGGIIINLRG